MGAVRADEKCGIEREQRRKAGRREVRSKRLGKGKSRAKPRRKYEGMERKGGWGEAEQSKSGRTVEG